MVDELAPDTAAPHPTGAQAPGGQKRKQTRVARPYPRATIEKAIRIPFVIKEKNGGNPWAPDEIASAQGSSKASDSFFYMAASSRDFGFTDAGRDSDAIGLTERGRSLVYAPSREAEETIKRDAFLSVDIFRRVLEYYKGSALPEMRYLRNTLEKEFGLHPDTHHEFSDLFRENCEYLGIGEGFTPGDTGAADAVRGAPARPHEQRNVLTLAEPETDTGLRCFVVMPFRERDEKHPLGFFDEVLRSLIAPAGRSTGFTVSTANRQGSDVIQSTIVNDLLDADLVVADLTEHNPNVLFELGLRMAHRRPVALIRARGTGPVFDVDNMLRVFEYDPNLWPSAVERDLPRLIEHIAATWKNRDSESTYMRILRRQASDI